MDNFQHFCRHYICIFVLVQRTFFPVSLTKDLYRRMSAKYWNEWKWAFSFSGVENWLLLHIICRTKRLNPFFRLHEASEVLNKYVMGVWQDRCQDFAARGAKKHKGGAHFLNTILDVCSNRGPNMKWGRRTPLAPHWRQPWSVDRFTAAFFVSFSVTIFVPDSAVAAQICPPQNAYRAPPMVISKKYFDITVHPETNWPS